MHIPHFASPVTPTLSSPLAASPAGIPQVANAPQVFGSYMQEPRPPAHDMTRTPPGNWTFGGIEIVTISGSGLILSVAGNRVNYVYHFHILFLADLRNAFILMKGEAAWRQATAVSYFLLYSAHFSYFFWFTRNIIHHPWLWFCSWKKIISPGKGR